MLKRIKLKNSTLLLLGIIIICVGICLGFYEYFQERKNKVFSDMNILLLEKEMPKNIENNDTTEEPEKPIETPNESTEQPDKSEDKPNDIKYNYIGILEIPKINLKRGFLDLNSKYNSIDYNVTVIRGSTFPNEENNNLILAAHSGNCKICFFDRLYNLSVDDLAYVYFNSVKYSYKIVKIYEVEKDGTVPIYRDYNKNTLTLITCTRYSNTKQTVYILELTDKQNY